MIPWLRAMTAMSQHKVNGTALLAGTMACSVSAATFIAQGLANVPVAAFLVRSCPDAISYCLMRSTAGTESMPRCVDLFASLDPPPVGPW